jgi:hypothetical protein
LIPIDPFSGEEIKKFLQVEFKINNYLYLDRIVDIAQGNPRLAVMAAPHFQTYLKLPYYEVFLMPSKSPQ